MRGRDLILLVGIHPLRIAKGYEMAADIALKAIQPVAETVPFTLTDRHALVEHVMTTLGSKIINRYQRQMAEVAVDAVLAVADLERKDVNLDLIKMVGKVGGKVCFMLIEVDRQILLSHRAPSQLEDTHLVRGIVLDKEMSHPQMPKEIKDAKLCILTCPFEPPKPKTTHKVAIKTVEQYNTLAKQEQQYFVDMVKLVKDSGATLVICQWGFDDEVITLNALTFSLTS